MYTLRIPYQRLSNIFLKQRIDGHQRNNQNYHTHSLSMAYSHIYIAFILFFLQQTQPNSLIFPKTYNLPHLIPPPSRPPTTNPLSPLTFRQ